MCPTYVLPVLIAGWIGRKAVYVLKRWHLVLCKLPWEGSNQQSYLAAMPMD